MARVRSGAVLALSSFVGVAAIVACHDDVSYFPREDIYSRRILDHVLSGPESVIGATVYVEPSPGFAIDEQRRDAAASATAYDSGEGGVVGGLAGVFTSTDDSGRFAVLDGPIRYDVTIRKGLDLGVFRGVDARGWDIPFLLDSPAVGFSSVLSASTSTAPLEGHSVAYFLASTAGVTAEAKSLANGFGDSGPAGTLIATYADYTSRVTLWAVEYETATGLTKPTRKGSIDLLLSSGIPASPVVPMTPIPDSDIFQPGTTAPRVATFAVSDTPPPGFVFDDVEIWVNFGLRRDSRLIGHVRLGEEKPIAVAFGGLYSMRVTATRADGAKLDSGLAGYQVYQDIDPTTHATSPVVIKIPSTTISSTFDGARSFAVTFPESEGIVEHVLVPQAAGGTTVRILTPDAAARLDDVTALGAAQPAGTYTWTTSYYPTIASTIFFAGPDVRYVVPLITTPPQTIVLK